MRTEQEMMELILRVAKEDERIRAAYLGGSRCNPNVPRDLFQDYDIVYVVDDIQPFLEDPGWIDVFGERLLMQLPMENDKNMGTAERFEGAYGYLIQLADGNRVDCFLQTLEASRKDLAASRLKRILLDKDGILPEVPEPSDITHWVQKPSENVYTACCNEFWWLLLNVAKGLWRGEILYAMDMLNKWIRPELFRMLEWQVGTEHAFSCSVGKCGKYLERYVTAQTWNAYLATFPEGNAEAVWESVDTMCGLFSQTARTVGERLGYAYPEEWERGSKTYLKQVRSLPKDAKTIF
ncbi:MAG: aminoglycoside 6-adenylyltransferase [Eubacteriales bacterium]|nr:aminoglycoside 6-adenylyltransferase [Eubacteriales bacterium]